MASYTKTLYDSTGTNILYPQTLATVVYTQDNQNVETVLNNKLTTPSGTQGQILGFTEDNVIGAITIPFSGSPFNTSFSGTISSNSSNWIQSNNIWYQNINISNMTSLQTPLVFPQWSSNIDNEIEDWNNLVLVNSYDGYVSFYSKKVFTYNVNFILLYSVFDAQTVELIKDNTGTVGTFTPI